MNSFITGPPKEGATLSELTEYLRPKSKGRLASEVRKSFQSNPIRQDNEGDYTILDELGIGTQEFAELALNTPDVWSDEQISYLESFIDGQVDGDRIPDLAEDYFEALPLMLKQPAPQVEESDYTEETRLPLMIAQPALTPINEKAPIPFVGETGDWWRKKK